MNKLISKIGIAITGLYLVSFGNAFAAVTPCDPATQNDCVNTLEPGATSTIGDIINNVITWVLNFAGAVAVLFIIYGGFVYITSSGNDKRVEQAKKILTYAVIGLIVIILARVIVVFVKTGTTTIINQSGN